MGGPVGFGLLPLFIIGHVFWFVVIALFIIFAIAGKRRRMAHWGAMGHYGPWGAAARGAEVTLAERFAQGDIDEKEYRARLEVLRANSNTQRPTK
jgi:putative membrane protein